VRLEYVRDTDLLLSVFESCCVWGGDLESRGFFTGEGGARGGVFGVTRPGCRPWHGLAGIPEERKTICRSDALIYSVVKDRSARAFCFRCVCAVGLPVMIMIVSRTLTGRSLGEITWVRLQKAFFRFRDSGR